MIAPIAFWNCCFAIGHPPWPLKTGRHVHIVFFIIDLEPQPLYFLLFSFRLLILMFWYFLSGVKVFILFEIAHRQVLIHALSALTRLKSTLVGKLKRLIKSSWTFLGTECGKEVGTSLPEWISGQPRDTWFVIMHDDKYILLLFHTYSCCFVEF